MEKIPVVSRTNALVKKLRKLSDKKYRAQFGEYVAEGKRWVSDALRLCPQNVVAVVRSQSGGFEGADYVLSDEIFAEIADTQSSQGVLALMRIPAPASEFCGDCCLFLDRVRDPGNMGAIIRTACAAGYNDIVLNDCVDVYNPKVIRSSMTGVLNVRFHAANSLDVLKENGYACVAASLGGQNAFESRLSATKICLVIGNEAEGISPNVLRACDDCVTIPMSQNMESLNAAVSAGILMYVLKYK